MSILGTIPTMVKAWKSTNCMEGLNWTKIRLSFLSTTVKSLLPHFPEELKITNASADPLLLLEKPLMLMMACGFLQELITSPLLKFVEARSLHQATSKELYCNHKPLEH